MHYWSRLVFADLCVIRAIGIKAKHNKQLVKRLGKKSNRKVYRDY
jgi:hypothetical protein